MGTVVLSDVTELETVKISELPPLSFASENDILPIVATGTTKKISKSNLDIDLPVETSRIVYVAKNGNDDNPGTIHDPFLTIQAAVDYAYSVYGAVTDFSKPIVIKISPGVYEEQIHGYAGYYMCSQITGWYPAFGRPPVTIYMSGVDENNYPLRSNDGDVFAMEGITIKTDKNGIIGKLPAGHFNNCWFKDCHFIEVTETSNKYLPFKNCIFYGDIYGGFNLTGNVGGWGYRSFKGCGLYGSPVFLSTHSGGTATVCFTDSYISGGHFEISGDWNFATTFGGFSSFGEVARNIIGTSGDVSICNGECVNGLHFTSAPNVLEILKLSFIGNEDNQIPDGEADITADTEITCDVYDGNVQHNGLDGEILIPTVVKSVGGTELNKYKDLVEAIKSVRGRETLKIYDDLIDLAPLVMPLSGTVTIEGRKSYSLTFTGDVVELKAGDQLIFYGLTNLVGGDIKVNGNGAYVGFEECLTVNAYVTLTAGTNSYCLVYTSTIEAPTGFPAIKVDNVNAGIIIGYSRVRGGVGHPALSFTVEADDKLKAKFSTILHGDGGTNTPLINTSGSDVNIAMYNCGLNAVWSPSLFTNTIGSAGNITDSQIDF